MNCVEVFKYGTILIKNCTVVKGMIMHLELKLLLL